MGKFRQFFTELSAQDTPIFSFSDDNLSKFQWIFTKLDVCIDIVEIWVGIANGQISLNFDRVDNTCNLRKCQGILTKHGTCIDYEGDLVSYCVSV